MEDELKPCPFCGRRAIETVETKTVGNVVVNATVIRCEGKTFETRHTKGCNARTSAADRDTAVNMWNRRE